MPYRHFLLHLKAEHILIHKPLIKVRSIFKENITAGIESTEDQVTDQVVYHTGVCCALDMV